MDGPASKAPSKKRKALASKVLTRPVKKKFKMPTDASGMTADVTADGAPIDIKQAAGVLADAVKVIILPNFSPSPYL